MISAFIQEFDAGDIFPILILGVLLIILAVQNMQPAGANLLRFAVFAAGTYLAAFGMSHLMAYWQMGML